MSHDRLPTSVMFGLAFSVGFTVLGAVGGALARDFGVHAYPPAIRARYGPKSQRGARVTRAVSAVLLLLIAAQVRRT